MDRDQIFEIVRQKGPILPVQLSREINQNVLIASAILGELVSAGKIKFSYTKLGGSPLYYVDGQEPKLQQLYSQLHDTEKKIYDLLKEKKILRDKQLEPAFRVALRNIRDFAIPLEINMNDTTEIFWRWYLISNEDIKPFIHNLLESEEEGKKKIEKEAIKKEILTKQEAKTPLENIPSKPIEKPIPEAELRERLRQELLKELREELRKEIMMQRPEINKTEQKKLEKERKKKEIDESDPLLLRTKKYCQQKNIKILSYEIIIKKKEIDLLISVPSAVGNISYYCKTKNKKKITDNDLSNAFLKGSQKKMPVLFLATGNLLKKTQEKLDKEFRGISFKNITNN